MSSTDEDPQGNTVPDAPLADYEALGERLDHAIPLSEVLAETGGEADVRLWNGENPWPWKPPAGH